MATDAQRRRAPGARSSPLLRFVMHALLHCTASAFTPLARSGSPSTCVRSRYSTKTALDFGSQYHGHGMRSSFCQGRHPERHVAPQASTQEELDEQQLRYMLEENVILVDIHDNVLGAQSKVASHLVEHGPLLHRAFSIFLFDQDGRMLMQRRAHEKITFPDHWTNTCCSHPLYSKAELGTDVTPTDTLLGVKRAAVRKLEHELGIPPEQLPLDAFVYMGRIHYIANSDVKWGEHEIDYVLFVQAPVTLEPNLNEVSEVAYMDVAEVRELFQTAEERGVQITPWARHIVEAFVFDWWQSLGDRQKLEALADAEKIHRMGECANSGWADPSNLQDPTAAPLQLES